MKDLISYTLHLADSSLILTQKMPNGAATGPFLNRILRSRNITLDLIGQSRNFYRYAAELINKSENGSKRQPATEDSLAYLRSEREFKNMLLVEQSNGDWAKTIVRQFFYAVYQYLLYEKMQHSSDDQLAGIAAKSLKEVTYHVTWCSEWVIRLGDGTAESNERMQKSIRELWPYTGELFMPADYETAVAELGIAPDARALKEPWLEKVNTVFTEAGLALPQNVFMQSGGKTGGHSERLGYILSEMQYLHRSHPGAEW